MNGWLRKVHDFASAAKSAPEPLAFVFGAGCSISSGAPTTSAVHNAFEQATAGRANGQNVRDFLQHIKESERQRLLAPLFGGITPHVGYRSVAALARDRRIHILNLNWDPLVEDACGRAGVPFVSFDLRDRARWKDLDSLPPNFGVLCVHVHGILGDSCRYSNVETLKFERPEAKFIRDNFWDYLTLIVGASLQGDFDLEAFLTQGSKSKRSNGLWYFGRGWGADDAAQTAQQDRLHVLGADPREFCVDPAIDFDRLILAVLEEIKEKRWDDFAAESVATPLPTAEQLVTVKSGLIRSMLDDPLLALVGEPRLGKTVLAHFLVHCFRLWSDRPMQFLRFDLPDSIVAALAGMSVGTTTPTILLLEDPFGSTDRFEENPGFFAEVSRLCATGSVSSPLRLVVTSRRQGWHTALGRGAAKTARFAVPSENSDEWYWRDDLVHLAAGNDGVGALVQQGVLRTPGAVLAEARRQHISGSSVAPVVDGKAVTDTIGLFEAMPEAGRLCSLVRLQDFSHSLFSREELCGWADAAIGGVGESFLHQFDFEGSPRFRLDHPTTREAADAFLLRHSADVESLLAGKLYPRHQLVRALDAWHLLVGGGYTSSAGEAEALDRWGAAFFAADPTLERLQIAFDHAPDQWALTELAYEVVRLWDALPPGKPRSDLLARFVADRARFGTYALFEACLYLQAAASPEIRETLHAEAWKLVSDPASVREAALMVDGWMWRPLPDKAVPSWIGAFLQQLPDEAPAWALVRFLEGYHPEGFAKLSPVFRERDRSIVWTREQAEFGAWLVKWHFAHQANARVLLSRLRLMDKGFLCRTLHPVPSNASPEATTRLIESMARFAEFRGWAFHLGCNVGCVQSRLNPELVERLRHLLAGVATGDLGVVTAAVTYDTARVFQTELRTYFEDEVHRAVLLDVLRDGVCIDGLPIRPPRFSFSREPDSLFTELGIRWPRLRAQRVDTRKTAYLAHEFWTAAQPSIATGKVTVKNVDRFCAEIESGDLRWLEEYATAARAGTSPLQQILDTYITAKAAMPLFVS